VLRSLFNQPGSLLVALVLAATIWVVATAEENPSREAFFPESLPIQIENRAEDLLVYQKNADSVRLKLRAPLVSWNELRPSSFRVIADLKAIGAGAHEIPLKAQVDDSRVTLLSIEPATVKIQLERLKTRELDARSDVLDAPPLGYTNQLPVVTPARVKVSGPAVLVDQVTEVVADIYLRGSKASVEREVTAVAHDAKNNIVQGVTIVPATLNVKVQIDQRVGYKDVSVKTVLKGTPASGYWVSSIAVNPSSVTIVGSPDAMSKVAGFLETQPIDISGASSEVSQRATLALPEGISVLSIEPVMVQVSVTPLLGGQTVRRPVVLQGLSRGLNTTISPDSVEVILSGPLPSLQGLGAENVQVVVDAAPLIPGTYSLKPRVTLVPEALKVQSIVPDTIQVIITGTIVTPTPAPTPIPTPTPIR
jgi:YbbR domain-containing protein